MADPDATSKAGSVESSPQARSAAQQVAYGLILVSLLVAVSVMGVWWIAADIPVTASTSFIFMFATGGVWMTIYRLLVLGIKRIVRGRIERRRPS